VAPEECMNEAYRVAGIDVHKSMLAVVVTDLSGGGEFHFERKRQRKPSVRAATLVMK
jgi:hypothetical protein